MKGQSLESIPSHAVLSNPGGTLSLSCKAVGYNFGDYSMSWIRQPYGKPLQWIGCIRTDNGETSYIKILDGRIEITKDNSKGISYVKLSGLIVEDTVVYYCARRHSDTNRWEGSTKTLALTLMHAELFPNSLGPFVNSVKGRSYST